jgi:hypothetical protein
MNIKKIIGLTALGCLSIVGAAYAGTGLASNVSISYYQTYATGNTVAMDGFVNVSGYLNPGSTNSVWYELHNSSGIYQEVSIVTPGNYSSIYQVGVPQGNYHLDLNPSGTNYNSVIASGKAQN